MFERLRLNIQYLRVFGFKGLRYPFVYSKNGYRFTNKDKDYVQRQIGNDVIASDVYRFLKSVVHYDCHLVVTVNKKAVIVTVYPLGNPRNTTTTVECYDPHYGVSGRFDFRYTNGRLRKVTSKTKGVFDPEEPILSVKLRTRNFDFYESKAIDSKESNNENYSTQIE